MLDLASITSPTLLLDEQKCRANIQRMADKARRRGLALAPHFKTHQSAQVGAWYRDYGIDAITVTSVKMAHYFAQHGWQDITIAFPLNVRELPAVAELAQQIRLTVFINSEATAQRVAQKPLDAPLHFYIEIDAGYRRSGVPYDSAEAVQQVLNVTDSVGRLQFVGFYTHAGHTYDVASTDQVAHIHQESLSRLARLKEAFQKRYPSLQLSLGDTPACSLEEDFAGVSVIRPGNFVYYDLKQHSVGSNTIDDIAICLACPVVSVHPEQREAIVHGGWVHLGKDSLSDEGGTTHFDRVVLLSEDGWSVPTEGAYVKKVSQEHGVISLLKSMVNELQVGDLVGILPVHACATADTMRQLMTFSGESVTMMAK